MTHTEFLEHLTAWSQTDRGIVPEGTPDSALHAWTYGQKKWPPDKRPKWRVLRRDELRCGGRCPITYLANKEHGSEYEVGQWEQASAELGLEEDHQIVDAADLIPGHNPDLRKKLLQACGVTERSA